MSKAFSAAKLRLGFGLGHPELIAEINKLRPPYNVDGHKQAKGEVILDHMNYIQHTIGTILSGVKQLEQGFVELGLETEETKSNFLVVHLPSTTDVSTVTAQLLDDHKIAVKKLTGNRFPNSLRICSGTPQENKRLLGVIQKYLV